MCLNHFTQTHDPTIEDSYRKQVKIDNQTCMLEILDTAGQEEYAALRDQWIRDGEGFVLVYDISSRASFARIEKLHRQIQRVKESSQSASPPCSENALDETSDDSVSFHSASIMLVGNKSDRTQHREVSMQEGSALAAELGCSFVETSAKNCINVEKAFYDVVRQLRQQRMEVIPPSEPRPSRKELRRSRRTRHGTGRYAMTPTENGEKAGRGCLGFLTGLWSVISPS